MKTAKDYLDEANAVVKKIDFADALEKHNSKSAIFIDVRDSGDIANTGTITDALKIQRGLIVLRNRHRVMCYCCGFPYLPC